jgi:hypothetical protein
MTNAVVLDPTGEWLMNTGAFPIHDPEGGITLPNGMVAKATYTAWLKAQPTVVRAENPWPTSAKEAGKAEKARAA